MKNETKRIDQSIVIMLIVLLSWVLLVMLSGCSNSESAPDAQNAAAPSADTAKTVSTAQTITNDGDTIITGKIDGQILVTAQNANLILKNADITYNGDSAILGKDGSDETQNLTIELQGENNKITSGKHGIQGKDNLTIKGTGKINITATKDGLHAGDDLKIESGNIQISKSYEGIEATHILISGGNTTINADDDGINATVDKGETDTPDIKITGGTILINAALSGNGDGLDANGNIEVTGGDLIIQEPKQRFDYSAIDYDKQFSMTGGQIRVRDANGSETEITEENVATVAGMGGGQEPGQGGGMPQDGNPPGNPPGGPNQ